jgi:hypothetical protein
MMTADAESPGLADVDAALAVLSVRPTRDRYGTDGR